MRKLLHVAAIAATIVAAPFGAEATVAQADTCYEDQPCWNCHTMGNKVCGPQVIEGCHWSNDQDGWVYGDDTYCRGTGEDPTTDSLGRPACASGIPAVMKSDRVTCIDLTGRRGGGGHHSGHRSV